MGQVNDEMSRDREDAFRAVDGFGKDEKDFRRLFACYYRPVHGFFIRRGFSREDGNDLTQETFLRAYRSMYQFRSGASIETWLFTIAANVWRNTLRSRHAVKRQATELPLEDPSCEDDAVEDTVEEGMEEGPSPRSHTVAAADQEPLQEALTEERARLLREALEELPPQMRRCMMLRVDQALKYREIAEVMAISIDTVKSQLSQARERLRAGLAGYFTDIEL